MGDGLVREHYPVEHAGCTESYKTSRILVVGSVGELV